MAKEKKKKESEIFKSEVKGNIIIRKRLSKDRKKERPTPKKR